MALIVYEAVNEFTAKITLNDPENLNAMGEDMAAEFTALTDKLEREAGAVRTLILTGAGRAFSAGGNLSMLEQKTRIPAEENRKLMLKFYYSFLGILKLKIPIIAAINGHAIGAGLCIASACDIRVCAEGAKLGFTFTKLGLHPGMGATYFLPRIIGYAQANELLLTARVINASEALRIGLVSKVVSETEVLNEALKIATEIAECGPEAVRQLAESLRNGPLPLAASLEREAQCQSINYQSAEFKEGVNAALEKRRAQF